MIMNFSSTMVTPFVNANGTNSGNGYSPSLAVGLTFFFLLLAIVSGLIVYKWHSKLRNIMQFGQRRSQINKDYPEATQEASHHYSSMHREQSLAQTPIYENLTRTTGYDRPAINQSRSPGEPEEDLYLQCDIADDAIYSNDPKCNLAMLPDYQEEDVYITPDS